MKVLIKDKPLRFKDAYKAYKRLYNCGELHELNDAEQLGFYDFTIGYTVLYDKAIRKGFLKGQIKSILAILKSNHKKQIPKRIVDALRTRTNRKELESLLIKAAKCQSLEDFEKEL